MKTPTDIAIEISRRRRQEQEAEIRRLLGQWVSGLEPVICYGPGYELLGLGIAADIGRDQNIVLAASLEHTRNDQLEYRLENNWNTALTERRGAGPKFPAL
jgi:hypothetical protein